MATTTVKSPNLPEAPTAEGYMAQAAQSSGYTGAQGEASNYTADEREVGTNATVKGQMEGLLSEGSRYLDVARQNAAQQANSRGFLNSTMAAGAGERAAISAALPIASQDASTYNTQSLTNQQASNQSRQFNAGADQQMTLANMQSQNQANQFTAAQEQQNSQFNAQSENQAGQFNAQQANSMNLATWSQESSQIQERFMAELNQQMELGVIDAKAFANLRGQYLDTMSSLAKEANISINEIQTNENIPPEEKTKMINQLIAMRDKDFAGLSAMFKQQPIWQQNWAQV